MIPEIDKDKFIKDFLAFKTTPKNDEEALEFAFQGTLQFLITNIIISR